MPPKKAVDSKTKVKAEPAKADPRVKVDDKKRKAETELGLHHKEARTEGCASRIAPAWEPDEAAPAAEKDFAADTRPVTKEVVTFEAIGCTLNVIPTLGGKVLMLLSDGGMQYLIAGARANVGVKSGRYMFEMKVVEHLAPLELPAIARQKALPRQLARIGFSVTGSELVLGEGTGSVCFDSEGFFVADGIKLSGGARFLRDQVVAVVLNVDKSCPNASTVALFVDGQPMGDAMKLPETLVGKTLFPHIAYRNVSVQTNFGPEPLRTLPFKCRMLQEAVEADVEVAASTLSDDGKCKVIFPVGLPDEGLFSWADQFIESHPDVVELSDRSIQNWALKSGLCRPPAYRPSERSSNDKPESAFGIPGLDDFSTRKLIHAVAPHMPRNYMVMEVKSNLVASDRAAVLKRFPASKYLRVAHVAIGTPDENFVAAQHDLMLADKQEEATAAWKARKVQKEKDRLQELKLKQVAEMRRLAEERRQKAIEDIKKKAEEKKKADEAKRKEVEEARREEVAAKKAAEAGEAGAEGQEDVNMEAVDVEDEAKAESKEEEVEEEAAKEEAAKEEAAKEEAAKEEEVKEELKEECVEITKIEPVEDEDEEEPVAALTEEEQKRYFRLTRVPDLTQAVISKFFTQFSLPSKSEGFDEVIFEWDQEASATAHLQRCVEALKVTCRVEDVKPGKWFQEKHTEWQKTIKEWQAKQKTSPKVVPKERKEGDEDADIDDEIDISKVDNVLDIGGGVPLFKSFAFEDWVLLQLRYELTLLTFAFQKDVEDEGRRLLPEKHLPFYYGKYFGRLLDPKLFGLKSLEKLLDLVKDTINVGSEHRIIGSKLESVESLDVLLKLAEENRRDRQRRIDAGDETSRLKFSTTCLNARAPSSPAPMLAAAAPAASASAVAPRTAAAGAPRAIGPLGTPRPAATIAPRATAPKAGAWTGSSPWSPGVARPPTWTGARPGWTPPQAWPVR